MFTVKLGAVACILGLVAVVPGFVRADPTAPSVSISKHRHPNLAAALRATKRADDAIHKAQSANEFDLGGHAVQALKDLDDAEIQLRMAATVSNRQHAMGRP